MRVDPGVPRKLGLKPGMSVLLVNAPAGYREALGALADGAAVEATDGSATGQADLIQLFCSNREDLEAHAPTALAAYRPNGRLWVCYPKGGSGVRTDLNRDVDWRPLAAAGFRAVTQIAIDATWSALRFRPHAEVGH
jgi:hypothetical protein